MAKANVLHRDIKPANILLNRYLQVKICDFGLSRTCSDNTDKKLRSHSSHVQSRWYRAPEVIILEKNYDTAIDMWSIGCIAYQLIQFCQANKAK